MQKDFDRWNKLKKAINASDDHKRVSATQSHSAAERDVATFR
jgi:hypothetical protein